MFKKLAVMVICASSVSPCLAAHWYSFMNAGSNNMAPYLDADTFVRRGQVVTFWVQYVYDPTTVVVGTQYSSISKEMYDCSNRTSQDLTTTYYDRDGGVIHVNSKPSEITDVIPGSVGEAIMESVCRPGTPSKTPDLYMPALNNDPSKEASAVFAKIRAAKAWRAAPVVPAASQ